MESDLDNSTDLTPKKVTETIPPRFRAAGYIVFGLGSIALTYLAGKGIVGPEEWAAWNGVGALFGFVAAGNVSVRGS